MGTGFVNAGLNSGPGPGGWWSGSEDAGGLGEGILLNLRPEFALLILAIGLSSTAASPEVQDTVERVVDGDTVILSRLGRARLIGVDSPEGAEPEPPRERFGPEAAGYTRKLLQGQRVRVERGDELEDRYGRALVYLYLEDGRFFNLLLVREGFAYAYTIFPSKYQFDFLEAEDEARVKGRGLWGALSLTERTRSLHGNSRSRSYHAVRCEYYDCANCVVELKSRVEAERRGFTPHWACIGKR